MYDRSVSAPGFDVGSNGKTMPRSGLTAGSDCPAEERGPSPSGEIDRELQAAIEYKIALDGDAGVERVLDYLNQALRRYQRG